MFNFQLEMVIIHQVGVEWRWQTFLIFMFIYFFHIFFKGNSRIDTTTFFFIVNTYNCSHNSELAMGILNLKQYEPSSLNLYLKVIVQIYLLPLLLHCSQSLTKKSLRHVSILFGCIVPLVHIFSIRHFNTVCILYTKFSVAQIQRFTLHFNKVRR